MADPRDITIPADLLPTDGRFGCGPSKVPATALQALADTGTQLLGTSHRKPRVKDQVARLRAGMAELFSLPDGYEVVLAPGGATAFWEMATFGLVDDRARHYVFGEFSSKFAKATAAAPFLSDPDVVEAPFGTRPDPSPAPGCDVQALTHNETSTGVMMDLERGSEAGSERGSEAGSERGSEAGSERGSEAGSARPDAAAAPEDQLVLVDATSGAGGLPVDPSAFDAYYFSLQKGFASEGGLAVALLSPAAIERVGKRAASDRYVPTFLSLATALDNSRKDQTYNTPAVSTVFLAAETVDWMNANGGLDAMVASSRAKATTLYDWAASRDWATPFVADPAARSLVVGTIDLDDAVSADDVNAALRANGILDTDGYRKLGRNQLRVGMFPTVTHADVEAYTACVDHVVAQLA